MNSLHHNGILLPPKFKAQGLSLTIKGIETKLNPEQEEMALAWAKKIGTPYVEDPIFQQNFHEDFSEKLGYKTSLKDVDYSNLHKLVLKEREDKAALSSEEKKKLTQERKTLREKNKEKYGKAFVDGEEVPLGNYMAEPNSLFMGRGQHPWRGHWKEGPDYKDIELNLSPDAPHPPGDWKEIVWDSEGMWIARWRDKLSAKMKQRNGEEPVGKLKYVWPGDSSFLKQAKDIEKYDKAKSLREHLDDVKRHINVNLDSMDSRRRKTAMVCYLIDRLKFRVGDEKDEDEEADTVGASTLRPEHLIFNKEGTVTFDFLGKDSVRNVITAQLDPKVVRNLRELANTKGEPLFIGVNSGLVGDFLKEVMDGLSAKVFRTCYATDAVESKLREIPCDTKSPDYLKRHVATKANLEAAVICNHKRTIPTTWGDNLQKKKDRLKELHQKERTDEKTLRAKIREEEEKYRAKLGDNEKKLSEANTKYEELKRNLETEKHEKTILTLKKRAASMRDSVKMLRERSRKLKNDHLVTVAKLQSQLDERRKRNLESTERMRLQVESQEMTKDYNLGTSLKNYVDPRVFYDWGKKVGYDWKEYYPTTLQQKFSWLDKDEEEVEEDEE